MKPWKLLFPLLALAALPVVTHDAAACTLEDCPYLPNTCYNLNGVKWCQLEYGNNPPYGHWTPVNSYNHSSFGAAVHSSWANWNYPPNGPSNSLYLYSDNINNANHDIDYWDTSEADWWWGLADYPGGVGANGCIHRGGGRVLFNKPNIPASPTTQLWLAEHETGHAFGLGHACVCPRVMNPCSTCNNATLTNCDGQAANALYH